MLKHTIFLFVVVYLMTCSLANAAENGVAKTPEKAVAKPAEKAPEKAVAKPVAKPVEKAVATPVAKPVEKSVSTPAAKTAEKAAATPAAKPVVKDVAKPSNITTIDNRRLILTDKQARRFVKLKSAGITIFYPMSVPARFVLRSIRLHESPKDPNYDLEFRDKNKRVSFSVATASSGIGDGPDGSRSISGQSKEFGAFKIRVFKPRSEGNNSKDIYYLSDWLTPKRKQTGKGARFYQFHGFGVNDAEALAIVRSLTPIK